MTEDMELEAILLDYVERFGLTEKARKYFLHRHEQEKADARAQTERCDAGRVARGQE